MRAADSICTEKRLLVRGSLQRSITFPVHQMWEDSTKSALCLRN